MIKQLDFDRFDLTAVELAEATACMEGVKLVHNLTDRGIIPFRKEGRSRSYSFGSLLAFDTMVRARGAGLSLSDGAKLSEIVIARAKERIGDIRVNLNDVNDWKWLLYAFDRSTDPPYLLSYIVDPDITVEQLQITLLSGWPSDVNSLFPIDRAIWECSAAYERRSKDNK